MFSIQFRRRFATEASSLRESKAAQLFKDDFGERSLSRMTIFAQWPLNSRKLPSIKMIGWNAKRAFQNISTLSQDTLNNDRATVMPIGVDGVDGYAVYFPATIGYQAQDSIEFYTSNADVLSKHLSMLGSAFKQVEHGELIKRLYNVSSLSVNTFPQVQTLIDSPSVQNCTKALRDAGIGSSSLYQLWKDELRYCQLVLSAHVSNESVKKSVNEMVQMRLRDLKESWEMYVADDRRPKEMLKGCQLTIFGPPNSGKSSFMNMLLRKSVSKVDEKAGSTTEVIDRKVCIDGLPILLTDTVGINSSLNVDKATISRMDSSDLKICILDMERCYKDKSLDSIDPEVLKSIDSDTIVLLNKRDLVNIRIPAPPAKIRFKQSPLSPQGDVKRHAFKGRVPLRLDGDTKGNNIEFGDYGLRVLEDIRMTESCLQECRTVLHRHVKQVRGGRFWLKVVPDHPCVSKGIGTRMGKGKAPFDHWEAKVPNKTIVFEVGGGVSEDLARAVLKAVGARVSGKTEFVIAPKDEMLEDLKKRISAYSNVSPLGVWAVSCNTGEGVNDFLSELVKVLKKRYYKNASETQEKFETAKVQLLTQCQSTVDQLLKQPLISDIPAEIQSNLSELIDSKAVEEALEYLFHSQYGILKYKEDQRLTKPEYARTSFPTRPLTQFLEKPQPKPDPPQFQSPANVSGAFCLAHESPDIMLIRKSIRLAVMENDNENNLGAKGQKRTSSGVNSLEAHKGLRLNLAIVGSSRVGKTCLMQAIQKFSDKDASGSLTSIATEQNTQKDVNDVVLVDPQTTRMYWFKIYEVEAEDLLRIKLQAKEKTTQEIVWPQDSPVPDGVLLCYDVTNRSSFMPIADILHYCAERNICAYLLGLKIDSRDVIRQVDYAMGENVSKLFAVPFTELSTLTVLGCQSLKNNVIFGDNGIAFKIAQKKNDSDGMLSFDGSHESEAVVNDDASFDDSPTLEAKQIQEQLQPRQSQQDLNRRTLFIEGQMAAEPTVPRRSTSNQNNNPRPTTSILINRDTAAPRISNLRKSVKIEINDETSSPTPESPSTLERSVTLYKAKINNRGSTKSKTSHSDATFRSMDRYQIYNFQSEISPGNETQPFRRIFGEASLQVLLEIINKKKVELITKYKSITRESNASSNDLAIDPDLSPEKAVMMQRRKAVKKSLALEQQEFFSMDDILGSYSSGPPVESNEKSSDDLASFLYGSVSSVADSKGDLGKPRISISDKTEKPSKHKTLEQLLEHLTSDKGQDMDFTKSVLFYYRKHYCPKEFITALIQRFDKVYGLTSNMVSTVQLRIVNMLNIWISMHFEQDFNPDVTNGKRLSALDLPPRFLVSGVGFGQESMAALFDLLVFFEILATQGEVYRPLCQKLIEACWNQAANKTKIRELLKADLHPYIEPIVFMTTENVPPPISISPGQFEVPWPCLPDEIKYSWGSSMSEWFLGVKRFGGLRDVPTLDDGISASNIATIFTQIMLESFVKIEMREWLNFMSAAGSKDRRYRISPNVTNCFSKFKLISQWVAISILSFEEIKYRAICFCKMVEAAWILFHDHHNHDTAMAMVTGLNCPSIIRLKGTRNFVQTKMNLIYGGKSVRGKKDPLKSPTSDSKPINGSEIWEKYLKLNDQLGSPSNYAKYRELYDKLRQELRPTIHTSSSNIDPSTSPSTSSLRKGLEKLHIKASQTIRRMSDRKESRSASSLFEATFSILSPSSPETRKSIFTKESVSSSFSDVSTSPSPHSDSFSLKSEANDYSLLVIPYLGLVIDDLVAADEKLPDHVGMLGNGRKQSQTEKPINWKKGGELYNIISDLKKFQDQCVRFLEKNKSFMKPVDVDHPVSLRTWVLTQAVVFDESLYIRSVELESDEANNLIAKSADNLALKKSNENLNGKNDLMSRAKSLRSKKAPI